eukprot:792638-Pelagomonas_calceolata.AAC.6
MHNGGCTSIAFETALALEHFAKEEAFAQPRVHQHCFSNTMCSDTSHWKATVHQHCFSNAMCSDTLESNAAGLHERKFANNGAAASSKQGAKSGAKSWACECGSRSVLHALLQP